MAIRKMERLDPRLLTAANARIDGVLKNEVQLQAPNIDNWLQIDDSQLQQVEAFIDQTKEATSHIGSHFGSDVLLTLNPDHRFQTHLDIMNAYVEALACNSVFNAFLIAHGMTSQFIKTLVYLHDYGRCVFNGPFALTDIDGESETLLRTVLPTFPDGYMHTIKWITEEDVLPQSDEDLWPNQKIALILKTIDTLGKIDTDGEIMEPGSFFSENGSHKKWAELQKENGRLPFMVSNIQGAFLGERKVTAEEYVQRDEALTRRGIIIIEQLTKEPFSWIKTQAEVLFKNNKSLN